MIEIISALALLSATLDRSEIYCLAKNIYHEARDQPYKGQVAVAYTTINRTIKSVCLTVYQPYQFSWTLSNPPVLEQPEWRVAVEVAVKVYTKQVADPTNGATHFYNPSRAKPGWAKCYDVTLRVKDHTFLKRKPTNGLSRLQLCGR